MNSYERFCFNLLGQRMKAKRGKYIDLRNNLLSARMKIPFEAYLATAVVTSILVGVVAAVCIGLVTFFLRLTDLIRYRGAVPDFVAALNPYSLILGTIVVTVLSLLIFGGVTYFIYLIYPAVVSGDRKRNIDATLPHAINYITAMSTAGITPAEIFSLLGASPIYGQSAAEARYISREIELFGKDLIEALRRTAQTTPSTRMKDFLQGAMSSISSGSNLTQYLRTKAEQYSLENRQSQKLFFETLALLAESYVTAIVAGTLFLILLQSIMSTLSGESQPFFLYIVIYGIIPFGSIMFIILISSMTPEG